MDSIGNYWNTCLFLNCRVWAMPSSKPCPGLIQGYLDQFGRFPELRQRGFSFLIDCSGRLFTAKKPSLKDVEGNIEAAETVGKISVYCHAFKNHVVDLQTILGPFSPWIWGPETVEKGTFKTKLQGVINFSLHLDPAGNRSSHACDSWPWQVFQPCSQGVHLDLLWASPSVAHWNCQSYGLCGCMEP